MPAFFHINNLSFAVTINKKDVPEMNNSMALNVFNSIFSFNFSPFIRKINY